MTPDAGIQWRTYRAEGGRLYVADDAPPASRAWLRTHPIRLGKALDTRGLFGVAYAMHDQPYVVKESTPPFTMTAERWDRYCGLGWLSLNVSLSAGLARIGKEAATLSNGATITAPTYFGALVTPYFSRVLMTHEPGKIADDTCLAIGTEAERCSVYNAALSSVGVNVANIDSYDEKPENILVRTTDSGATELVRLDLCDWPVPPAALISR
jgi:hypothetical protein